MMRQRSYTFGRGMLLCLALALLPQALAAQIFTPTFMGPRQGGSLGVYVSDFDPGDLSVEGIYRQSFGSFDLGLRAGIVDAGGSALSIGGEYRNPLSLGTAPVDIAVTAGAQGLIGEDDADWFGLQAGLSVGGTFRTPGLAISPYVHPRIGFVEGPGDDDLESDLLAEIGADFEFATRLAIRLAIGLDDTGADWGIGLAWR